MDGMDEEDGDTIIWRINVFPPEAVEFRMQNLEFRMMELTPNPFNDWAVIRFTTDETDGTEGVMLGVYDISGRLVNRLFEGRIEAGEHTAVFGGEGLPPGVYFVRLQAANYQPQVRKLLLVR